MSLPTQHLPENYHESGTLDITKDARLVVLLNAAGLLIVAASGWLFFQAIARQRPEDSVRALQTISIHGLWQLFLFLGLVLVLTAFHVILHEAVHGIFFWVFTRSRPHFAFRWAYAYAAAPGWFLPRNAFLVTTLAPLVLISLLGLALIPLLPASALPAAWYVLTMNAGGAAGDILVAIWIARQVPRSLIRDRGDAVTLYVPGK